MIKPTYRKLNLPENAVRVFEGILFDVYEWDQVLYDGSTMKFERLVGKDIGKAIAVTTDGMFIIIEDEQPARPILTKFPGGYVDAGELPEESALRELLEETGYKAESATLLMDVAPWNKVDYHRYYYVAKGCTKVAEPLVQAGERVSAKLVSFDELLQLLADQTIDDPHMQLLALQALSNPEKMAELKKQLQ